MQTTRKQIKWLASGITKFHDAASLVETRVLAGLPEAHFA
jgi:hypothetical protein